MAQIPYKIYLDESELPQAWYNLRADMKNKPAPLLNPATHQPMTFDELRPVFCDELVRQELDDTTPLLRHPRGDSGLLQDVPALPLNPRGVFREGPGHPRQNLLQV